ncbi:NADH:ubiquinone oxidoreductase subunit NDUFA12 [Thalassospira sp.]|uniref:NADH:ubiquinone oxidoreductase subunit NDUFA12 n=1 Tax=Thalassospira sp. TaxID=1912094 RepID=UPI0032F04277
MATVGTRIYTALFGKRVGEDRFGNIYYTEKTPATGRRTKRWVVYKGIAEGSKVPAEWHAWLHHTVDAPLSDKAEDRYDWQKEHLPNLTGTKHAYRPAGHEYSGGKRAKATGDYQAWSPEG